MKKKLNKKQRRHQKLVVLATVKNAFRSISRAFTPECKKKFDFFMTFILLFLGIALGGFILYVIVDFIAMLLTAMFESIWPAIVFPLVIAVIVFMDKYGDDILPADEGTDC